MELVRIQEEEFCLEDEINRVKERSKSIGAVVTFIGTGRDISKGESISGLEFEHYEGMTEKKLSQIRERALNHFNVIEVSIVHRIGKIGIGENIVLIIVASQHRNDAFLCCEWCIAELKRITPIWKKEFTAKGAVWVEEHP